MSEEQAKTSGFQLVGEPQDPDSETQSGAAHGLRPDALGPIDFGTFVLSLSASAAIHLGLAPASEGGEPASRVNAPFGHPMHSRRRSRT